MTDPEWDYDKKELSKSDISYAVFAAGRERHCSECDDVVAVSEDKMRNFSTGATRDSDDDKVDYEGFLSPSALKRYAEYMHSHRKQSDGKMRDSDNWQKGIPLDCYMKSLWRHVVEMWTAHRSGLRCGHTLEDLLCAVIFNAFGYLHEITKYTEDVSVDPPANELGPICLRCRFRNNCSLMGAENRIKCHAFVRKEEA